MKVLITGANGYIGRHVAKELLDRGHEVIGADLSYDGLDERAERSDVPIFSGDSDIYEKFGRPDLCIHLAWRNGFDHNNFSHVQDLPGHYLFLRNMMQGGLPHLSVMSTMHEVGYFEGAISEDTPTNPLTPYGIAKNALRELVQAEAKKDGCVLQWLRAYYIVGDDARNSSIFTKLSEAAAAGKEKFPFTSGKSKFDFISIEELAHQIAAASLQTEVTGIINCCSGEPVSLAEEAEKYIREHHFTISLDYGKFPDRADASPAVWGNPDKIRKILENENRGNG